MSNRTSKSAPHWARRVSGDRSVVDGFGVDTEPLLEEQSVFLGGLVHIVDGRRALVAPLFHDKRMIADGVLQDDFARSLLEP